MLVLFSLNVSLFAGHSTLHHAFGNCKGGAPATSAPLFGGQPAAGGSAAAPAAPLFGAPPAAAGGSSAPSAPLFGAQAAAPSFGSTKPEDSKNAASVPVFGSPPATTTATDSNKKPATPSFTGFGASTPANTPAPAPTNGKPSAAPAFTGFSAASTGGNLFGNPSAPPADGGKAPAAGFSFAGLGGGAPGDPSADKDKASGPAAAPLFPNLNTAPGGDTKAAADASKPSVGFGFGAASSTTPAPATTAADGSKKAPPLPAFNFNAAPAAGGSAPATGGFSLSGAPTTPADNKTPATPNAQLQDPATPAPVSTPVPNAGSTAVAGTPAPVATPEPKPLHYQTLTVEQILNKFQKELEKDAMEYIDQAKRVCEYDAVLRDSQRDLAQITTQTQRLMLEQQQVEKALEGIGALQDELDSTLSEVEGHVDELFARQSHLAPQDADFERERAYATASTVDRRLEELKENMAATASQINSANERAFTGDVANIVAILNQHQDGLSSLQNAARKMEMDVTNISRMLNSTRF